MSRKLLTRAGLAVLAVLVFGWLFIRSLVIERAAPYAVPAAYVSRWTLVLEPDSSEGKPLLALHPPPELASHLFRQIFSRAMESLNSPVTPSIPVVLRDEYDRTLRDHLTPDAVVEAARRAGLDTLKPEPTCIVHRRVSVPGSSRQVFLVAFEAPQIEAFRRSIGLDAAAMSPVMFVAGAGTDFSGWLPLRVAPGTDCVAPVDVID